MLWLYLNTSRNSPLFSNSTVKTLQATIISHLDYFSSHLTGLSVSVLAFLQSIYKSDACWLAFLPGWDMLRYWNWRRTVTSPRMRKWRPRHSTGNSSEENNKSKTNEGNVLTGRKNKFCARRIAAWLFKAERLMFDVLAVGGIVSSDSLRKNCKENGFFQWMSAKEIEEWAGGARLTNASVSSTQ